MKNDIDKEQMKILIRKYLKNTCTKQEFDSVYDVLSDDEQFDEYNDVWTELWNESIQKSANTESSDLKEEAMHLITDNQQNKKKSLVPGKFSIMQWAAILIVFLGIGFLLKNVLSSNTDEYLASYGQVKEVVLADGSMVSLGATSNLSVPKDYSKTNRDLSLKGMAFFEVQKDKKHKFTIHTDAMKVTVLGTSFTIRSFDYESNSMVTVNTGKVQVDVESKQGKQTFYVTPDEQLIFNKEEGSVSVIPVESGKYILWIKKKFYFNNTSLNQVITDLQNMYHVKINLTDLTYGEYKISGEYSDAGLDDILNSVCFVYGLEFKNNEDGSIVIYDPD